MTICIAACLFLCSTGSLSLNRDVGSATPTTGAAWPKTLTDASAKSSTTAGTFFMAAILRQPRHSVKGLYAAAIGPMLPSVGVLLERRHSRSQQLPHSCGLPREVIALGHAGRAARGICIQFRRALEVSGALCQVRHDRSVPRDV